MTDLQKLAQQMRADWDRRIRHDYRFWMSDGHTTDDVMWATGERDFDILTQELALKPESAVLEVGCGVGRLLRAAAKRCRRVIGVDVSTEAISKARELLGPGPELVVGNGFDLESIQTESVDLVYSFAAITSIPTAIIANYLKEFRRILKPGGTLRLQVYIGKTNSVREADTLHLRCYAEQSFRDAAVLAGFDLQWVRDLVLPIQVSFEELGIGAKIVSLTRSDRASAPREAISAALLPEGEFQDGSGPTPVEVALGSDLEYWVALNYAKDLVERGEMDKARETLEYAIKFSETTTIDVRDVLERIISEVQQKNSATPWQKNRAVLAERFPAALAALETVSAPGLSIRVERVGDNPVLFADDQCLDHATKPQASADVWAKRSLQDTAPRSPKALCVFGFGAGYHVESLATLSTLPLTVVEASPEVIRTALEQRDLTSLLGKLSALFVGPTSFREHDFEGAELLVRPQSMALYPAVCTELKSFFYGKRGLTSLHPTIAVLGPLQGGSLPIAGYTMRSLQSLKQRVREWDVSGFSSGYSYIEKFFFDRLRTQGVQNIYVEMVSQVLLESFNDKKFDVLVCMAQAPISGRVLTELRNRGVVTVMWFMEDYCRFTYWKQIAPFFDYMFTIQRGDCLESIAKAGAGQVHYLPMACDPGIHQPTQLTAEERQRWGSPVSFVGAGYHNRQQMFAGLSDLPFKIWGTEWPECKPFDRMVQEGGRRLTPVEYVKIFNATDININLHSSSERDGVDPYGDFVNPRTFELAASGAFQLVDERSLLPECFEVGKEIITFSDPRDLKAKIAYYLAHPEERQRVADAARARVLRDHTYDQRLKEMLSVVYSGKYEHLKRRQDSHPWRKMLDRTRDQPELHARCDAAYSRGEEPNLDALVSDIVAGKGKLTETEQKLLFLYHVRKQIIRMTAEEMGLNK